MAMKVGDYCLFSCLGQSRQESVSNIDFSQTLSAKNAAALDKDLMSIGAFSIDQLMELAGLSVSQAGLHRSNSCSFPFLKIYSLSRPPSKQRPKSISCLWTGKQW